MSDQTDLSAHPELHELREQVVELDRGIVEAMNTRIELVTRIKRYKDSRGLDFVDPDRERWLIEHLERENRGPLTPEGLRELYATILGLTKREVAKG